MAIFTILYGNYYPPHGEFKLICIGKLARWTWVNFTQKYGKNRQRSQQNKFTIMYGNYWYIFIENFPQKFSPCRMKLPRMVLRNLWEQDLQTLMIVCVPAVSKQTLCVLTWVISDTISMVIRCIVLWFWLTYTDLLTCSLFLSTISVSLLFVLNLYFLCFLYPNSFIVTMQFIGTMILYLNLPIYTHLSHFMPNHICLIVNNKQRLSISPEFWHLDSNSSFKQNLLNISSLNSTLY